MKDEIKPIEPRRLRSHTISDTSISSTLSATVHYCRKHRLSTTYISQINFVSVHSSVSSKEIANCSRPQIHISEEEAEEIRLVFHLFLSQKLYLIPNVYLVISWIFIQFFQSLRQHLCEDAWRGLVFVIRSQASRKYL